MVEIVQTESVGADGVLRLEVSGLEPGRRIEIRVREDARTEDGWPVPEPRVPDAQGRYRTPGRLKGLITIAPDFDDPIPGMEPYS